MSSGQAQLGFLTLTGTLVGYGLYAGIGYVVAGPPGAACGAALLTALLGRQIWHATRGDEASGAAVVADAEPDAATDRGGK